MIAFKNSKEREKANVIQTKNEAKKYAEVKNGYFDTLSKLKNDPNNPELKQETLKKGREFSALSREYQGQNKTVTVYDEMALMNDINAACAGAMNVSAKEGINNQTVEERLAKLSKLKQNNLISEQEYSEKRKKVLDEI
jgi:hypothetical protein